MSCDYSCKAWPERSLLVHVLEDISKLSSVTANHPSPHRHFLPQMVSGEGIKAQIDHMMHQFNSMTGDAGTVYIGNQRMVDRLDVIWSKSGNPAEKHKIRAQGFEMEARGGGALYLVGADGVLEAMLHVSDQVMLKPWVGACAR